MTIGPLLVALQFGTISAVTSEPYYYTVASAGDAQHLPLPG